MVLVQVGSQVMWNNPCYNREWTFQFIMGMGMAWGEEVEEGEAVQGTELQVLPMAVVATRLLAVVAMSSMEAAAAAALIIIIQKQWQEMLDHHQPLAVAILGMKDGMTWLHLLNLESI